MRQSRRVILGLDPGLAVLGYGLIASDGDRCEHLEHGCVFTLAGAPVAERLGVLFEQLSRLRRSYPIADVAMESLYARRLRTAVAVGEARGVAILAVAGDSTRFFEYTPTQVKEAIVGFGRARKRQVQEMVALALGLAAAPEPDDAADALAVALCHARGLHLADLVASTPSSP